MKIINNKDNLLRELLEGYTLANHRQIKLIENTNYVVRTHPKENGKVKLVIENGSGHEPVILGMVGEGMFDLNCCGNIFVAPSGDDFFEAIKMIDDGSPILILVQSHAGDIINSRMAYEMCSEAGMDVNILIHYDDVTTAPKEFEEDRRGTVGIFFYSKIVGALAEQGASVEECIEMFERCRSNTRTIGFACSFSTHPITGMRLIDLPDGQIELGAGAHGEGGSELMDFPGSKELAAIMCDRLIEDKPYSKGDEVLVVVNGMGSTSMMELSVFYRDVYNYLKEKGITVYDSMVGEFLTSQEQGGITMSVCKVDDEMKRLWDAPCDTPIKTKK